MIRRTHRKLDRRTPRRGGRNEAPFLSGRIRALEEFVFCERGNERLKEWDVMAIGVNFLKELGRYI